MVSSPPGSFPHDWYVYYGSRDQAGPTGFLNLNMYSTHPAARPHAAPGRFSTAFPECRNPAQSPGGAGARRQPMRSVAPPVR